ncbi:TPA: TetR/AcrR family transcriptional regulator [Klebsiella pneumoniae]|nr:TetR/AcrR family transcriptional regulator [Klebsiella pneumoniae]HDQ3433215.1 TetR/AcrR family transcriptional regulator [Klebsiella pneumoniae]
MGSNEREKRYNERRESIIEAAKTCFSQHGFHGASMSELIMLSGFGAGQLYRFFPGKDSLINEVVRKVAGEWREFLFTNLNHDTTLNEILDINSVFWAGWQSREHSLLLESYSEASRNEIVRKILMEEEEKTIAYLEEKKNISGDEKIAFFSRVQIKLLLTIIDGFVCRVVYDVELEPLELTRLDIIVFGERQKRNHNSIFYNI